METTAEGIDQSLLVDLIEEIDRDLTIRKEGHIRTKEESNFILRDLQIPLRFLTSIPRIMKQSGNDDANTLVDSVVGDFFADWTGNDK